jgi:hypothetical protein
LVTLFTDTACGDGGTGVVPANAQCDPVALSGGATSATFHAYEYSATVANEACGMGSASTSGGVALTGQATICCQ